jgi:hypothetical protein
MATAAGPAVSVEYLMCYCCGKRVDESSLVRFHEHPAEGVCAGCAEFLHKRSVAAGRMRSWPWWRRSAGSG